MLDLTPKTARRLRPDGGERRTGQRASAGRRHRRRGKERRLTLAAPSDFDSPTGKGAVGTVDGRRVAIDNAGFLAGLGAATDALEADADHLRGDGATVIFVAMGGRLAGIVAIADPIKSTTLEALREMKAEGIRVIMLTGDNRRTAEAVACRLGIKEVEAEVLPDQKSAVVERLKREGRIVAMAGDGVNDALALAAAGIGIAMGSGTDVAIESAEVTLLRGDLTSIARARRLSHATMRNIRQNLFFAFVYNASGVPVAAVVLYPFFGLLLSPVLAVIANALRLRFVRIQKWGDTIPSTTLPVPAERSSGV